MCLSLTDLQAERRMFVHDCHVIPPRIMMYPHLRDLEYHPEYFVCVNILFGNLLKRIFVMARKKDVVLCFVRGAKTFLGGYRGQ